MSCVRIPKLPSYPPDQSIGCHPIACRPCSALQRRRPVGSRRSGLWQRRHPARQPGSAGGNLCLTAWPAGAAHWPAGDGCAGGGGCAGCPVLCCSVPCACSSSWTSLRFPFSLLCRRQHALLPARAAAASPACCLWQCLQAFTSLCADTRHELGPSPRPHAPCSWPQSVPRPSACPGPGHAAAVLLPGGRRHRAAGEARGGGSRGAAAQGRWQGGVAQGM